MAAFVKIGAWEAAIIGGGLLILAWAAVDPASLQTTADGIMNWLFGLGGGA